MKSIIHNGEKIKANGDCFEVAGNLVIDHLLSTSRLNFEGEPYLVHAEVRGQGKIEGLRFAHAWIEDDEYVYDNSNGKMKKLSKFIYYLVGDIQTHNPKKHIKYTFQEAKTKMLKTGTYGSWELETLY